MQRGLLISRSAVETKDIEMITRRLNTLYSLFTHAMTQLGAAANIYSKLCSRREKRRVALLDYWGTLPDDWAEYMGIKQFFELRLAPDRAARGIPLELFDIDADLDSPMTNLMYELFMACKKGIFGGKHRYRYWGNFCFSRGTLGRYDDISPNDIEGLRDVREAVLASDLDEFMPCKRTALRLASAQPWVLNHRTPVIQHLWRVLGKVSQVNSQGGFEGFATSTIGVPFGIGKDSHLLTAFNNVASRFSDHSYLVKLLKALEDVEDGVLIGGYSMAKPSWYSYPEGDTSDADLVGFSECDSRNSIAMYYYGGITDKCGYSRPGNVSTRHLFAPEQLRMTQPAPHYASFKLKIRAAHANLPTSIAVLKDKASAAANLQLEQAFRGPMEFLGNDATTCRSFFTGPKGFKSGAYKDYLVYSCEDAELGSWLTLLLTGIRLEFLCLGVACQGFQGWAIENDLVTGNEKILEIFNKIGRLADKMALETIPEYYLRILQSWEDNSDGFSSLKGWEREPVVYEL